MKKVFIVFSVSLSLLLGASVTFSGIPSSITAGEEFQITITRSGGDIDVTSLRLVDSEGNYIEPYIVTDQEGWENSKISFSGNTAVVKVKIRRAGTNMKLRVDNYDGESGTFTVKPAPYAKIQILLPGEEPDPGSEAGKKGSATEATAGVKITGVRIRTTDEFWNLLSGETKTAYFSSSDPFARLPGSVSVTGEKTVDITIRRKGTQKVYVTDKAGGDYTDYSSITVKDAGFTNLLILAPGEEHAPGDTLVMETGGIYPGKRGDYEEPYAKKPYVLTIIAVDSCWNQVSTLNKSYRVYIKEYNKPAYFKCDTVDITSSQTSVEDSVIFEDVGTYKLEAHTLDESVVSSYTWEITVKYAQYIAELTRKFEGANLVINERDSLTGTIRMPSGEPVKDVPVKFNLLTGSENATLIPPGVEDTTGISEYSTMTDVNGEAHVGFKAFKEGEYKIEFVTGDGNAADTTVIVVIEPTYDIKVYPSPLNRGEEAKIEYVLEEEAEAVTIVITDMYGNVVFKDKLKGLDYTTVGRKIYRWNGFNSVGTRVASGVYLVRVRIDYETNRAPEIRKAHLVILW